MSNTSWDKTDKIALAASVAAHAVLFGLLSIQLSRPHAAEMPKPIAVEILAETDLEATSTNPSDETPAAMKADEGGPVEDAPASMALPEPTPVMPEPEPIAVTRPDPVPIAKPKTKLEPTRKPVQKAAVRAPSKPPTKPAVQKKVTVVKSSQKAAPAKRTPTKIVSTNTSTKATTKTTTKTSTKAGSGTGKGNAVKPSGDLAGMVGAVGKSKGTSAGAPGKSAAQIKQSITTSIGTQVRAPWNACKVSGIDVDALTTTVKFRLNKDGSLSGFTSATTSGQNDSNKNQVARHQECAKKAITQASPFTGLPPEHYSYWQNYEFKFQKR